MRAIEELVKKVNTRWLLDIEVELEEYCDGFNATLTRKGEVILGEVDEASAIIFLHGMNKGLELDFQKRSERQLEWTKQWNRN